jgi:hypothetical protein
LLPWPFHTAVPSRGAFFTHEKAETKSWEAVAINHHSSNHSYTPVLGPEQLEISRKERHTFENDVDMNKGTIFYSRTVKIQGTSSFISRLIQ